MIWPWGVKTLNTTDFAEGMLCFVCVEGVGSQTLTALLEIKNIIKNIKIMIINNNGNKQ